MREVCADQWVGLLIVVGVGAGALGCEDAPPAAPEPTPQEHVAKEVEAPSATDSPREDADPDPDEEVPETEPSAAVAAAVPTSAIGSTAGLSPQAATPDGKPPADAKPEAEPSTVDKPAAKPTGPVIGQPSTVVARAAAEPGYKCNDAFPHKFTTSGGRNVEYPQERVRAACSGKGVSVSVPYIPKADRGAVAGTLKYGICDDAKTNCRIMTKAVTVAFSASEK